MVRNIKAPEGDGNVLFSDIAIILICQLETSKPRKGTETRFLRVETSCLLFVRNIKAPEGDGNINFFFVDSVHSFHVRNIKAPEGDGNFIVSVFSSLVLS